MDDNTYDFDLAKAPQTIIKVIGVGGGGGNAVSNMYREGIRDVSFVLCNTDNQALQKSEVPNKLLIGQNTTHGLGSGNVPEVGEKAALESEEDIYRMLDDGTRMAFVTAGMGGGTVITLRFFNFVFIFCFLFKAKSEKISSTND